MSVFSMAVVKEVSELDIASGKYRKSISVATHC